MYYKTLFSNAIPLFFLPFINAQLSGSVGPTTTFDAKKAVKVCDVTSYGGVADGKTDVGPAISKAFNDCKSGGVVNIPSGDFAMSTWQTLSGGKAFAINLDGTIIRTGTAGGHMIIVQKAQDFEMRSTSGKGAMQGYGYQFHQQDQYGPRLVRLASVTDFSFHDIALVDSPAFHLVLDTAKNGEVYNVVIKGGDEGGLDGIDVWGSNVHIHDVEVTNKDECVTVKNPSNNMLIENIYCNWSGGCAMGSLGADTAISNIVYSNVYSSKSNQMYMFKSNGGSGTVSDVTLQNFIGHGNAYSFYIQGYWSSQDTAAGNGVLYNNITANNWKGTCANGVQRGPIEAICPDGAPCTDINISDFAMWTDSGSSLVNKCRSAWGTGGCLASGTADTAYSTSTSTVAAAPSGYSAPTMPNDLASGLGITASIDIPALPTSYFPGVSPLSAVAGS